MLVVLTGTPTNVSAFQALSFRYTRGKDLDMAETLYVARARDAAASITTLEAAMKDARIALPSKETAAGSQQ